MTVPCVERLFKETHVSLTLHYFYFFIFNFDPSHPSPRESPIQDKNTKVIKSNGAFDEM
jgi:hypothetical protein